MCVCESSIYFLCVSTSCRHALTRQTIDRKWWIFTALEPPGEIFVNILSIHDFAPRINNQSFLHIFLFSLFHFLYFLSTAEKKCYIGCSHVSRRLLCCCCFYAIKQFDIYNNKVSKPSDKFIGEFVNYEDFLSTHENGKRHNSVFWLSYKVQISPQYNMWKNICKSSYHLLCSIWAGSHISKTSINTSLCFYILTKRMMWRNF